MKIRCPTGEKREISECRDCQQPCMPAPIRHALLHGRDIDRVKKEKPAFGISTLTANCLRQSYYRLTKEQTFDLEKLWIFSRGHAIHFFSTRTLPKEEKEIFVRREFPAFEIIGFVDALHDGVVYEFKTTSNIPETPQAHHILQGQAYYSLLPPELKAKVKKILLIYLSMQRIKSFEIPIRDITSLLEARAAILAKALREGKPPKKELTWLCNYCEFKEDCEKED